MSGLKKVVGRTERPMGLPRDARPGDRFRPALERADRDPGRAVHPLAGYRREQVLRLAQALRQGERAQCLGSARPLAHAGGTGDDPALYHRDHIDEGYRRGHRGGEPLHHVPRAAGRRRAAGVEPHPVDEGARLSAAAGAARPLARGHHAPPHRGDVFLSLASSSMVPAGSSCTGSSGRR